MCSSPFYSVLFFDAEHKQLAENVIQSHDDELYRKLRVKFNARIFTSNVMQAISIRRVEILALKNFSISRNLSVLLLSKTNFRFVI